MRTSFQQHFDENSQPAHGEAGRGSLKPAQMMSFEKVSAQNRK
jgi:hypothetical protein